MSKSLGLGLVGVLVIVVIGGYWYTQKAATGMGDTTPTAAINMAKDASEAASNSGTITSIKDAMGLGTAMKCTYTMDAKGKSVQSEVLLENGKFRATTMLDGEVTGYALSDGSDQYTWSTKSNQGMKITQACLEQFKSMAPAKSDAAPAMESPEDKFNAAQNIQCTPTSNIDFSLPKDITFTDQCAMMKGSMEMMKQMQDKMPQSVPVM